MMDKHNSTPLHVLCTKQQSFSLAKYILNASEFAEGVSKTISVKDSNKNSPLHILCKKSKFTVLDLVLNCPHLSSESLFNALALQDNLGDTVFHIMVHRMIDSLQFLGDIHSFFKTFLYRFSETDIVSLLKIRNNRLICPLHVEADLRHINVGVYKERIPIVLHWLDDSPLTLKSVRDLCSLTSTEGDTLLHMAVNRYLIETTKVLIENKLCDPNKSNDAGQTCLHQACINGYDDIIVYLCEHGCNAHALDKRGSSPLAYTIIRSFHILPLFGDLISKGYVNVTDTVMEVGYHTDHQAKDYCYIMKPSDKLSLGLPLLHTLLYHRYTISSVYLHPLIGNQAHIFHNVCDTYGNTVLHLLRCDPDILDLLNFPVSDLNKQNNEGNTPLHIACATGRRNIVRKLIESDKCTKSLSLENVDGHTPLYYASDREIVNLLVMNGADPSDVSDSSRVKHITDKFKKAKEAHPLNQTVTALVLGNSMAGKTTLIRSVTKALKLENLSTPSIGQINDRCERTAGIEISEYDFLTKGSPRILFYDFAGHPEFHGTHSILLQNLVSSSKSSESDVSHVLFIVVVDITASDKLKQLRYWAKFIEMCISSVTVYPDVVVIGSHLDQCQEYIGTDKGRKIDKYRQIRDSLNKTISDVSPTVRCDEYPILLNCRDPDEENLDRLDMLLKKSAKNLKRYAKMDERCHLVFSFLYEHFPDKPINFSEFQSTLRKRKEHNSDHFVFTQSNLIELLKKMHNMQHILLIGNVDNEETHNFWILTAKAQSVIFKDIHGVLFAGEDFDTNMYGNMESNVGVISSAKLIEIFPDTDYEMFQKFLVYSEFCKKIDDEEVLQLIESGSIESDVDQRMDTESTNVQGDITDSEVSSTLSTDQSMATSTDKGADNQDVIDYFFFPSLVKETKSVVWKHDKEKFSHSSGWCLKCVDNNFFTAMFLQVLLLRLTFQFAATTIPGNVLHRKCVIWKNGLFWSSQGVEMLVQVIDQNQVVLVLVRCLKMSEMKAVKLRSAVLKEVFNVKRKHCQACKTIEYVICDPSLDDSGLMKEPVMIAMQNLASSLHSDPPYDGVEDTNGQYHLIEEELLYFEPYACVGKEMLKDLFDPDKASESLKKEELKDLTRSKQFHQLVDELEEPVVYQSARLLFDRYSVFHGRDPKVSSLQLLVHACFELYLLC